MNRIDPISPRPRILVVDDNQAVLDAFRKMLVGDAVPAVQDLEALETAMFGATPNAQVRFSRFDVDLVADGARGCELALGAQREARPYAVAFVDMRMPGGWDGLKTIEELWRIDGAIQVVVCTAYSDHAWSDVLHKLNRGDRLLVLRKPFETIEVLQLANALSQKWLLQRAQEARLAELEHKVQARVDELRRANRTLRILSQCNEALVRAGDESELLLAVCRHIVQIGGYRMAWVGYARHDEGKSVEPVAHAGSDRDYVDKLHLTWGDDDRRRGVGGSAIRMERPVVARSISADPVFETWREDALARGFASCIALPLLTKNGVLGTLSIYAEEPDAFDAEEIKLLKELAEDLGYGIANLRETHERQRIERDLERQANFDSLTGLANRSMLQARLLQCLADARRHQTKAAMIFIDLDRFKVINDTLGHAVGDRVLVEVGRRLSGAVRESDTVARLGGDEFVVFLNGVETASCAAVAGKIVALLGEPLQLDTQEIRPTGSLGISMFPNDGGDAQALMKHADMAMYNAKSLGGNTFRFFSAEMNERMAARYAMEADLRRALQRGELCLHYQPQGSLTSGAITGAEALVRWRHPVKGMVSPAEFIPLAEETGLIQPLGEWVIATACAQWRAWLDAGLQVPPVGINLSARQFRQENLVSSITQVLLANRLDPGLLELEITESAVMHDVEAAIATVHRLKALGVRISLDDFGTGYSSLSHLKRFPIDRLKIDQSFVREVTTDPDDAAICNAVIGLARNLKLSVIAEGVETEAQQNYLRRHFCDEMQGYLFSPPLPADKFARLLADKRTLALPAGDQPRCTLLIVDDEENVANAIKRLLRRDGYHIITAYSAAEGLQRLAEVEVDVIVSDQRMPGMTGVEFLRRAKQLYPDTVRMVLSGYTELQSITDAINEGAIYKFLTKPWNDQQLRAHIEEACRTKEMADANRRLGQQVKDSNQELADINDRLQRLIAVQREQMSLEEARASNARDLLKQLPVPIIGFDADGLVAFVNRAAEALWLGASQFVGRSAELALPVELGEVWRRVEGADCSVNLNGRRFRAMCHSLNNAHHARGKLMVMIPQAIDH